MSWKRLFPCIFLFSCIDGFISNWLYPQKLPLLYRDFFSIFVFLLFLQQESAYLWLKRFKTVIGNTLWYLALAFLVVGVFQIFNPLLPSVLVGLLGFKITFLYWLLTILSYAYVDGVVSLRKLLKLVVYFSVPINLFGIYQYIHGWDFLVERFGPGFLGTAHHAFILNIPEGESFYRIIGTFASSGQYTQFLLANSMFCISLFLTAEKNSEKTFNAGLIFFNFFTLLCTGSRSGLAAQFIGIIFLSCFRFNLRRTIFLSIGMSIVMFAGFKLLGEYKIKRFDDLRDYNLAKHRTIETTYNMFYNCLREYPLGRGLGMGSTASRFILGEESPDFELVENHLTKTQLEFGIIGVVFFYSFVLLIILKWVKLWNSWMDDYSFKLTAPISAYCLTQLALTFLLSGFDTPPGIVFFWGSVGLVIRMSEIAYLKRQQLSIERWEENKPSLSTV